MKGKNLIKRKKNGTAKGKSGAAVRAENENRTTPTKEPKGWSRHLSRLMPVLVIGVGYALLASLLLRLPQRPDYDIRIGQPSPVKIVAPSDLTFVDAEKTRLLQKQAAERVIPVFNYNPDVQRQILTTAIRTFNTAKKLANQEGLDRGESVAQLAEQLDLAVGKNEPLLQLLLSHGDNENFRKTFLEELERIYQEGIVESDQGIRVARNFQTKGIYIVDPSGDIALRAAVGSIRNVQDARRWVEQNIRRRFPGEVGRLSAFLTDWLIQPNLQLNENLWVERQEAVIKQVPNALVRVQKNLKLLDEGDMVPPQLTVISSAGEPATIDTGKVLEKIVQETAPVAWSQVVARTLLILVPLTLWGMYVRRFHRRRVWKNPINLACLVGVIVVVVGVGQVLALLGTSLPAQLDAIGYAVPVAVAGLLISILLNANLAFFSVLVVAVYLGMLFDGYQFFLTGLTGGLVSILGVSRVRRRTDLSWAGVKVGLAVLVMGMLWLVLQAGNINQVVLAPEEMGRVAIWSILNGMLTIMLTSLFLPWLEHLMGVVTDIQLLELSQKNELLKRLEMEAPGTYQHSMNVANLAESAAEAIGVNGLLARVGALYHDIGKLSKPAYFSENQISDNDKKTHEKLTPSMSRLLICNHIKDGVELAERENLPDFVKDAICQHHGTTLLTYFYDKALRDDSKDVVQETDYRYPGPKPQTTEMAIIMLADSLEAASRSLPLGLNQGEIYQFVRKIINQKFIDNQFEHSNLTLSDLHRLAEAFTHSLVSLLHRRVPYPSVPSGPETEPRLMSEKGGERTREQDEMVIAPVGAGAESEPGKS
jgi:cyclic-di-AMP phosphodiesterase PgpH